MMPQLQQHLEWENYHGDVTVLDRKTSAFNSHAFKVDADVSVTDGAIMDSISYI